MLISYGFFLKNIIIHKKADGRAAGSCGGLSAGQLQSEAAGDMMILRDRAVFLKVHEI